MAEDNLGELLKPTGYERAHKLFFLLAKAVPLPLNLAEIAQTLVGDPSQKRLEAFFKLVAEQLQELAEKVDVLDFDNPAFQSTCIHATEIALRTHLEEKHQLLCNAILNSAVPSNLPEEAERLIYMDLVEKLSPLHLKILKLFAESKMANIDIQIEDPTWVMVISSTSPLHEILDQELPETIGHDDLRLRCINDLYSNSLIAIKFPKRGLATRIENSPKPTGIASGLLKFLETPLNTIRK